MNLLGNKVWVKLYTSSTFAEIECFAKEDSNVD